MGCYYMLGDASTGGPDQKRSEPDPGGPDQNCSEVICNCCEPTFAQIGSLIPGDLVRWRVFEDFVGAKSFTVEPAPGSELPVYDTPPIRGVNGRTKFMQVRPLTGEQTKNFAFVIKIDKQTACKGFVVIDAARRRRHRKPANKKA